MGKSIADRNKKVWRYYVNGKRVRPCFAFQALYANQRYMELLRYYPNDEMVPLWNERLRNKKIDIRQEDTY